MHSSLTIFDADHDERQPSTAVHDLFAAVLRSNPTYLPGVAAGSVPFGEWYRRKSPQRIRLAGVASVTGLAGHSAVRLNGRTPQGLLLEEVGAPRLAWELGMLVVRPGVRGVGIASTLVREATAAFSCPLWASVHVGGPGHRLLDKCGWVEVASAAWPGDAEPGIIMVSTAPAYGVA